MADASLEANQRHTKSKRLYEKALVLEPGGVQGSDQRGPFGGFEPFPIYMTSGDGPYIRDVDGNRYTDYLAAWGPLILGHRPAPILEAVHRALDDIGSTLGFCHELDLVASETAINVVPSWEQVRFCNTGTEAVMLALRTARGYTGRTKVLRFEGHYHGWADVINFSTRPDIARAGTDSRPVPVAATGGMVLGESLVVRQWNDAEVLEQTFSELGADLAAVICEPLLASSSVIPPKPGYLQLLRRLASKHGVVLIFDEVKSGFRVALGGAQELYGVLPDLSVASKALGAGFAVAAVGGRKDLFEPFSRGQVTQGSSFQANPMALAACIATIKELCEPGFFERITTLGQMLAEGLTALANEVGIAAYARGVGPMFQIVFADHAVDNYRDFVRSSDNAKYREFWRGMVAGGVMFDPKPTGCWFVSAAHSDQEIATTLDLASSVLMSIAAGSKKRELPSRG